MWCYQKPGFAALLLAELQRQQQSNQFCDTLLKTKDVSVPAHSCILSAISPQISSSLSTTPPPPTGQNRLLEFRTLGACTLLHLVRLLYSGQMTGEGEEERQEAVSAAARLGIHGLVEVTTGDEEREEEQHREVGVQTEPLISGENERRGRWSREERDGRTLLWRETDFSCEKDSCSQTEELQADTAPSSHPAASYETIDIGALQTLQPADPYLILPQIHHMPVSLTCQQDENLSQVIQSTDSWAGAAGGELDERQLQLFQGNIPGYINYFLNPHLQERPSRGRPRGRRTAGTGGTRRVGTERGVRRPRAKTGGRGALTQMVDVQTVGVSRIQKMFLQRWGVRMPRAGQGGGAAGRRLFVKTRELLQPTKSNQRGRRRGIKFSQSGDMMEGGDGNMQQSNQDNLPVSTIQRGKQTSASFSSPSVRFSSVHHATSIRSPTLHPSPSPGLISVAASYVSPAPALLHTTSLPPPAPPPNEPERIDRLLEEVMIGLDILPKSKGCNVLAQNKQQDSSTVLLETGPSQVVDRSSSAVPVLQQQGGGELNDMLENFLQSFEQHVDSCSVREEVERGSQTTTEATLSKHRKTRTQNEEAGTQQRGSQLQKSPAVPQQQAKESVKSAVQKKTKRRRKNVYPFTLEKKKVRVREKKEPALSSKSRVKTVPEQGDKQLQQMPVVKLERSDSLPVGVTLQGCSCQSLEDKNPTQTNSRSTKSYPIRSRFREAQTMDSGPFLHEPLPDNFPPSADKPNPRRGRRSGLCSSLNGEGQQSVNEELAENNERQEEEIVHPGKEEVGSRRTGQKRGLESKEETSHDTPEVKRLAFERTTQPIQMWSSGSAASADMTLEDFNNVDTRAGDCVEGGERGEEPVWRQDSQEEEEVDVDGGDEDKLYQRGRGSSPHISPDSHSADETIVERCKEDGDEDIDVVGGSSPAPAPAIISWSDTSGSEDNEPEEDVDVVGEKADYAISALFSAMNKGELGLTCS